MIFFLQIFFSSFLAREKIMSAGIIELFLDAKKG